MHFLSYDETKCDCENMQWNCAKCRKTIGDIIPERFHEGIMRMHDQEYSERKDDIIRAIRACPLKIIEHQPEAV